MRRGFTLIELIFVIVIIGVLSAVAVPKFQNLKQSAEASNVLKVGNDAFGSVPASYVNHVDMEGETGVTLKDLIDTKGKGWAFSTDGNTTEYKDPASNGVVVKISLGDRNVTLDVNCSQFKDSTTATKCGSLNGDDNETSTTVKF